MIRMHWVIVALVACGTPAPAPDHASLQRELGAPTASHDRAFTGIDGVRELRDGRVIVLDARDRAIHVIDLRTKSDTTIGRLGDGPGEFRLPRVLLPIGDDTTLVDDVARFGKLLVITPTGEMGGFVSTQDSALGERTFVVGAADAAGRFYENNYSGDSNSVIRWDRARGTRDVLGHLSMKVVSPLVRPRPAAGGAMDGRAERGGPPPPFSTVSQWAVSTDGHVAIVTPDPYRVMTVSPKGARVEGQPVPFIPVPVGDAEKAEFRVGREQPVPVITYANGAQTFSYRIPEYTEPEEWPSTLPAFLPNAVSYASDGMLWVKRATPAGAPPLFDVFDATARRAYQLELPSGTKLVGFGVGAVYLARVDEDDLHYLQRYALPE